MVSVKRVTLPESYIDAARRLVDALEHDGYNIDYAFFYLQYDEDQEWYNGDWWLRIATNDIDPYQGGTRLILDTMKVLNIDLPEFDFRIVTPNFEQERYHYFDRIDMKSPV